MALRPQDVYGESGGIATAQNQGVSSAGMTQQANPQAAGAQIGEALSQQGQQISGLSEQLYKEAAEAKVNDDYANKYTPAAADLRAKFDMARGPDKIPAYDEYIGSLHQLNSQFSSAQTGPYGQRIMSSLIDRHVTGEIDGAKRELVEAQKQYSDQSQADMLEANKKTAINNYNNPQLVDSLVTQNDNHILLNHINKGIDPNNPDNQATIAHAQTIVKGQMAAGMINKAVSNGDVDSANTIRADASNSLPGFQKLAIDNTLHTENIKQAANNGVNALMAGKPLPETPGASPAHVQALVADTAKQSDIDPNHALTVLRIESSNGQDVGARGTLGQDKESAGKPLEDQAKALCNNLKVATSQASSALGRDAQPWEGYVVYQQGAGGGPALLKAAQENPNQTAMSVLAPLYKNPKDAIAAVNNNGGNSTMTASDFVQHIQQVYTDNAKRANCNFGDAQSPGAAIMAPHQQSVPAVQQGASPMQALLNFQNKEPAVLDQINAIPNEEVRRGVMKAWDEKRTRYQMAAADYKNVLVNQASQFAQDPKFTSMSQLPSEMQSALLQDSPHTLNYMESMAKANLERSSGVVSKDAREYGAGFYSLFKAIHDPDGGVSAADLQGHVGEKGDLTIAGYDRLVKEMSGKGTPDAEADGMMKKQFFANAKQQISSADEGLGIKDPKGEEQYLKFMARALNDYDEGRTQGKSPSALLNPDSNDYIGKSIPSFKRSLAQQMADISHDPVTGADLANKISAENGIIKNVWRGYTVPDDIATPKGFETWIKNPNVDSSAIKTEAEKLGLTNENSLMGLRYMVETGKIPLEEAKKQAVTRGFATQSPTAPLAE